MRDPIADLVHRYADAVVHHDDERWAATWAPDGMWKLGRTEVNGRDAILETWRAAMAGFAAVVQTVQNGTYDLDERGGIGTGRWYVHEHFQRADGGRGVLLAHYDDRYVRVDGHWFFAARELRVHYGGPPDLSGTFLNAWS